MKKVFLLLVFLLSAFALNGCGQPVVVNNGEIAVIISTKGMGDKIYESGAYKLPTCWFWRACPRMVRMQGTIASNEVVVDYIYLPKDTIALENVAIGIQFRVKQDKASRLSIFATMPGKETNERSSYLIPNEDIFDRHVKLIVPEAVISALKEYDVIESLSKTDEIAAAIQTKVNESLAKDNSPIEVTRLSFPNGIGKPPEIVSKSLERKYAIQSEMAREIEALEAALKIEEQRQAVQLKRAQNDDAIARFLRIPVELYTILKVYERFADAAEAGTPVALGAMPFMTKPVSE